MAENRELALVLKLVADNFNSELKKSGGMLSDFNKFISDWKTQLVAAGGALFAIAKSTANYGEELLKTSQKVGVNIEALAGLQHAANLADVSHEQLSQGLKFLSANMVEAARRTGDGEALFYRLGVSAVDATGKLRPTEQVLLDLADKFSQAKDGAGKTEAAVKLFGKAGQDLIPFLNQGKAGITELMAEAQRLGLVMSKDDAEAANHFNDQLKILQATMRGLTLEAGKPLVGVLTELAEMFQTLTQNSAAQFFFRGLAEQAVLFTTLIKEAAANVEFLFGKFTFDQLRTEIARIEAEAQAKLLLLENPKAREFLGPASPASRASDSRREMSTGPNLAKMKESYQLYLQGLISMGKELTEAFKNTGDDMMDVFNDHQAQVNKERDLLMANQQAWVDYYDQLGGNAQDFLAHKTELLQTQLAKELDLTQQQSKDLLAAWMDRDSARADEILKSSPVTEIQKETAELNAMRQAILNANAASDDFFTGWFEGMRRYVKDTKSGFGFAADMARRTAQLMESSFRTFFFDAMEGRIKSFKDVLRSLLDFVKQIVSQIAAQLVTSRIIGAFIGGGGPGSSAQNYSSTNFFGGAAMGGQVVRRFAMGGPVPGFGNQDSVPALLTPGEVVLSRRDVGDIKSGMSGGVSVVVNNYAKAEVQTSAGPGVDGKQMLYITVRDMVKGMARGGDLDGPMSGRYGLTPKPTGR